MAGTTYQTVVSLEGSPTGTTIPVAYNTMPGNQPADYGNTLFLWQSAENTIPWASKPQKSQSISTNTQTGSAVFNDLNVTTNAYIIGYAVGPDKTQICASVYVPAIGGSAAEIKEALAVAVAQGNQDCVSVQAFPGSTSVQVNYHTLDSYEPAANKNWVGIWERGTVPLSGAEPIMKVGITSNSPTGSTGFNNIPLLRGHTYAVGYFMGEKQSMLAASYTFTV